MFNETKAVVIYPRGFLGYDIGLKVKDPGKNAVTILNKYRLNKPRIKANVDINRSYIANTDIELLYEAIYKNAPGIRTMEFREKVYRTALKAFGTNSFFNWCELQLQNNKLSDTHIRFLNDTLGFIKTGTRQVDVHTWDRLIGFFNSDTICIKPSQFEYRDYFGLGNAALLHRPFTVVNAIQSWVSQPGGVEDMVHTLKILFGNPVQVE